MAVNVCLAFVSPVDIIQWEVISCLVKYLIYTDGKKYNKRQLFESPITYRHYDYQSNTINLSAIVEPYRSYFVMVNDIFHNNRNQFIGILITGSQAQGFTKIHKIYSDNGYELTINGYDITAPSYLYNLVLFENYHAYKRDYTIQL